MAMSAGDLRRIETAALEVVSQNIKGPANRSQGKLKLTGLEVLAFIAVKVALPMATGMMGRALYDKVKPIKKQSDADAIRVVLLAPPPKGADPVDEATLVADAVARLREEGIDEEQARKIAKEMVQQIRSVIK